MLSGLVRLPGDFNVSTIITAASGRPFTPLAGADLNGDGDGGAFPADRARTNPEAMIDVFNLLGRVNYTEINNIFGRGAFPNEPQRDAAGRVTYGVYKQALPCRQIQLGAKIVF